MAGNSWPASCSACDTCRARESKQAQYRVLSGQYTQLDQELQGSKVLSALGGVLGAAASITAAIFVPGIAVTRGGNAATLQKEEQRNQKLRHLEGMYHQMNALHSEIVSMICPFGGRQQAGGYVVSGQGGFAGGGGGGFVPRNQPYQGYDQWMAGPGRISGRYNVAGGGQFDQPGSAGGQYNPPPQSTRGAQLNTVSGYDGTFNSQPNPMGPGPGAFSGNYNNPQTGSVSGNSNMGYQPSSTPAGFSSGQGQYMAPAPVGGPYNQPPGVSWPGSLGSSTSQFGVPGMNGPSYPTEFDSRPGSSGSSRNQLGIHGPPHLAPETRFSPRSTQILQQQEMYPAPSSTVNNGSFHHRNPSSGHSSSEFSRGVVDGGFSEAARAQSSAPNQVVYAAPGGGVYGQQQFVEPGRPGSSGGHPKPNLVPTRSHVEDSSSEESDDEEEEIQQHQQHPGNGYTQNQQQEDPNQQLQAEPVPVIHENGQHPQRGNANVQYQPQPQLTVAPPGLGPPELRSVRSKDSSSSDDDEEEEDDHDLHGQKPHHMPMAADLKVPVQDAQPGMRLDDASLQRLAYDRASMPQTTASISYDRNPAYATDHRALQPQVRPQQDEHLQRQTSFAGGVPQGMAANSYERGPAPPVYGSVMQQEEHLQRQSSSAGGVPQGMVPTSYERGPAPPVYGSVMQQKTWPRAVELTVPVQEFQEVMRLQDGPRGPRAPAEVQPRKVVHRQESETRRRGGPDQCYPKPQRQPPALPVARVVPPGAAGAPPLLYSCASCSRQLQPREYRYNCDTCKTFDLCPGCYSKREFHHPYHKEFTPSLV